MRRGIGPLGCRLCLPGCLLLGCDDLLGMDSRQVRIDLLLAQCGDLTLAQSDGVDTNLTSRDATEEHLGGSDGLGLRTFARIGSR